MLIYNLKKNSNTKNFNFPLQNNTLIFVYRGKKFPFSKMKQKKNEKQVN